MKHNKAANQDGLVAIVVVMILMVLMSLITLGFSRIMQREQRQAIDHSLSVQAYYAAESGINDAIQKIRDPSAPYTGNKVSCGTDATFTNNTVSPAASLDSSYSCLLINQSPPTLEYNKGSIKTTASTSITFEPTNPADTLGSLKISWGPDTGSAHTYAGCGPMNLPSKASWVPTTGMLRVDLVPAEGSLTRDNLIANALNLYLYPVNAACAASSTITYPNHAGLAKQGQMIAVPCNVAATPRDCNITIDLAGVPGISRKYSLRLKSVYNASNATITGYTPAPASAQTELSGAQVQIDSTGRVNDVVKRIQVRIPKKQTPIPEYSVESMDGICKRIDVAQGLSPTGVNIATGDTTCP